MPWPLNSNDTGRERSYAIDVSIIGHFRTPREMRNEARKLDSEIRIGWKTYNSFCHFDFAFNYPHKNEEMKRRWVKGGEW
jgi:hypothetical protein